MKSHFRSEHRPFSRLRRDFGFLHSSQLGIGEKDLHWTKAVRPTEWARGSQRVTRAHPLSGLTALHEVQVSYGHHYRRTWEVKPRQQQRRKPKDPSAKMTSLKVTQSHEKSSKVI